MGRIAFILFLVVAMPIGIHHTFEDPQVGSGFKYLHSVFTAIVALPTLLTVFTICASVEIAGRLRGGKGVLGWLRVLPWRNPVMLGAALSFVMLGFGGAGGLINMSYQLNATVHNTQWVTGHFHLIYGGAIVIMYFVIAYDIWPHLTLRALDSFGLMRAQLWLWFVGMIVLTFPWHWVGILGMPRRMAFYDYTDPAIAPQAAWVTMSVIGGAILVLSGVLFLIVLARGQTAPRDRAGGLPVQCRGTPAARIAGRAERLWALAQPDGGPDHRELRLSDRTSPRDARNRGSGGQGRGAPMSRERIASAAQSLVHRKRRDHRRDRNCRCRRRLRLVAARPAGRAFPWALGRDL